jgi:hypothetical protein
VALGGKGVAAGVAQHVGMGLQFEPGSVGGALDHAVKARRRERDLRSLTKTNGEASLSR